MGEFSRIKDPRRLKTGDVLYFPPKSRAPKLNVALRTLAKMGVSMGNTRRADNSAARVAEMLVLRPEDKGEVGSAMMVGRVITYSMYNQEQLGLLGLMTNDSNVAKEVIPPAVGMYLHAVPMPGYDPDEYELRSMWTALSDRAVNRLSAVGVSRRLFYNKAEHALNHAAWFASDANATWRGKKTFGRDGEGDMLSTSSVADLMAEGMFGDSIVSRTNINDSRFIYVRGKFAEECVRRGAILLRPSEQVIDDLASMLIPPVLKAFADSWTAQLDQVRKFTVALKADVKVASQKPKAFMGIAKKSVPGKARINRLRSELGKELGYGNEHRLPRHGDRRDADAVETPVGG